MTGRIVQRGKTYTVVIDRTVNGERKQRWAGGYATKQEAKDDIPRLLQESREGVMLDKSTITVGQWLDRWLKEFCLHVAPYTKIGYGGALAPVKEIVGGAALQAVSPVTIQQIIGHWVGGGLSSSTIRQRVAVLSDTQEPGQGGEPAPAGA
jgi:integrase